MRKKILVLLAALLAMTMSALLYANSLENSAFALKVITEEPRSKIPCWSAGGVSLENPELGMSFVFCLGCVERQGVPTGGKSRCEPGGSH